MTRAIDTLKSAYLRLPRGLRARVPVRLEIWAREHALPRLLARGRGPVTALEARLWGGFSQSARAGLETLRETAPPQLGAEAALALARWHGVAGNLDAALAEATRARALHPALARDRRQVLLEALYLCRLGRGAEARALLRARGRFDPSVALMRANTWNPVCGAPDADGPRALAEINAVLVRAGLAPLAFACPRAGLTLDNLTAPAPSAPPGPRVSVLLPVWNAAATLPTALASLAAQTHTDLDVLIVDDASGDESPDIAADAARADPRFRLIRLHENRGGYAARNRTLEEATGEYVTVHDADDWSHPERIARHLADLRARDVPFNVSAWVRATSDLAFWGPWRPAPSQPMQAGRNFSSVFCRRDLFDRMGPWDTARISADAEFVHRVERVHRLPRQHPFLRTAPLAFGRASETSLTRASATHAATLSHGVRREYHEAAGFWHARLDPAAIRARGLEARPPYFPAPPLIASDRGPGPRFGPDHDLLVIGDFNFLGGTQKSALAMIAAARGAGFSTALLHYRRYDQDVTQPLNPEVRRMAGARQVRIVAPGEALRAAHVVVSYPPVFDHCMDRFPKVDHDHLTVVVNQMAARDLAGSDVAYDPARVRAHLVACFGTEGVWVPISARVRALMTGDPRYPAPSPDTWTPLLDAQVWRAQTPPARWRGGEAETRPVLGDSRTRPVLGTLRTRPILGRHGRDHPLKWPRDRDALRAAYCADRPCETRFLGGARHAAARVGRWPVNWRVEAFGARAVPDFLAGLDVFAHFPDPDYIEEFGRAPMEAMAMGVPVILPPEFAPTFGEAALYCAAHEVWGHVERLWSDRAAWEARADAGRAFVAANCDPAGFPARLARRAAASDE